MSQTPVKDTTDIIDTAQALIQILRHGQRKGAQWLLDRPSAIPWGERAAMLVANAVVTMAQENWELRARVVLLERTLRSEGKSIG